MIRYVTGNLLEAQAEALVNAVNCVGVMGKGIALQFKQQFPENYEQYRTACDRGEVRPGQMFVYSTIQPTGLRFIEVVS
jgi:O-acetyl-ADP-ribose deacetylase (regulator of RNase III)